jgi:hypothetical protein
LLSTSAKPVLVTPAADEAEVFAIKLFLKTFEVSLNEPDFTPEQSTHCHHQT